MHFAVSPSERGGRNGHGGRSVHEVVKRRARGNRYGGRIDHEVVECRARGT
jgi:hypothetical protein